MTAYAPYPPAPPRRIRWWLVAVSTVWAALLVLVAIWAMHRDAPTVREQRTLAQAQDPVRRAVRELIRAADPAGVLAFGPPEVSRGCRVTPVRPGASAVQDVVLRVRPGTGPDALDAVADRLPPGWDAGVRHRPDRDEHRLEADPGDFVEITGRVEDGGSIVRLRAATGCRPDDDPADWPGWTPAPAASAPRDVLDPLGLTAAGAPLGYGLDCGADASATSTVTEAGPASTDLAGALRTLVPADALVQAEADLVAYRTGAVSTVVSAADGRVRVARATAC